ncbi:hypothetical protein IKG28_01785 [Candidatus Saccharibacteria bacterium]|nr:hypothetical protein [Candidatus Saccharibacteria bacterium]MBR3332340.1 hypothetical protein [Candidatus Saccharibacteria bacterium]
MAEIIKLPNKVWEANWKDDVDVDYAIYGNDEKEEAEYIPPEAVSKESIEKIKSIDLKQRFKSRGKNVFKAFNITNLPDAKVA